MTDEISTAPEPEEMLDGIFDGVEQYELRKQYAEFWRMNASCRANRKEVDSYCVEIDGCSHRLHLGMVARKVTAYSHRTYVEDERLKELESISYTSTKEWFNYDENGDIKLKSEVNIKLIKSGETVLELNFYERMHFNTAIDLLFAALDGMKNYKEKHENHCS